MATRGVIGRSTALTDEQMIDWMVDEIVLAPGWDADPPPAGWLNDLSVVKRCVATLLVKLDSGDAGRPSLKQAYADGYRIAKVTKGFHQREDMVSFVLGRAVIICHLTVQLAKDKKSYRTIHIYVTAAREFAGATLWDVALNRAIS